MGRSHKDQVFGQQDLKKVLREGYWTPWYWTKEGTMWKVELLGDTYTILMKKGWSDELFTLA